MQISATVEGVEELTETLTRLPNLTKEQTAKAMNQTIMDIHRRLVDNTTEQQAIDTGALRDSWQMKEASPKKLEAQVGTHLVPHYAPDIEYGTKPHYPYDKEKHMNPLIPWVQRKLHVGKDRAWIVAHHVALKIKEHGTKARPIFRPAASYAVHLLANQIQKAAKTVESKMT